jgi:hypothetical protein
MTPEPLFDVVTRGLAIGAHAGAIVVGFVGVIVLGVVIISFIVGFFFL